MTTPPTLASIESRTLGHYEEHAADFWEGTRFHDVSQSRAALLSALSAPIDHETDRALRILDLGCGPGRDLAAFRALGHEATGLDGCAAFASMARAHTGCEVLLQSFFSLDLGDRQFDGVFANASLFHVPRAELPRILASLHAAIVPTGVLFCSNPRSFGVDDEGFSGARYGSYLTIESWTAYLTNAGFGVERTFLRPDTLPERERPWVAQVARRASLATWTKRRPCRRPRRAAPRSTTRRSAPCCRRASWSASKMVHVGSARPTRPARKAGERRTA